MNGYFQLHIDQVGTSVLLFPPTDGGASIETGELLQYLTIKQIAYDARTLGAALQNLIQPTKVLLNMEQRYPEREGFFLRVSPDKMQAVARFYPPSNNGAIMDVQEIIGDLHKLRYSTNPYNINRLTLAAGSATIDSQGYYDANCQKIMKTREYVTTELEKLGFFVLPSKANFIFASSDDIDGGELYLKLKDKGVLIRHFTTERIKNFNRITIGTPEEMQIFIDKVKEILEEN